MLNDGPLRAYIGPIYLLLAPTRAAPGLFLRLLRLHSASTLPFGGRFKPRWCCRGWKLLREALRAGRARLLGGPRLRKRPIVRAAPKLLRLIPAESATCCVGVS